MFLHKHNVFGLAINTYLIGDTISKKCAVVDPTRHVEEYIKTAESQGLTITDILETHVHADFISGASELKFRLQGSPTIHCSGMGGKEWIAAYADHIVYDGDEVNLGNIRLKALHTPGHTPEHISWALFEDADNKEGPSCLFTGDFLFFGDVGRPDLLGDSNTKILAKQMYNTLFCKTASMPDCIEIFPAHGAGSQCGRSIDARTSSTLGDERNFNEAFKKLPEKEWVEKFVSDLPPPPKYFHRVKLTNLQGPALFKGSLPGQKEVSAEELHDKYLSTCCVIDLRSKEAFAAAHISKAINISLNGNVASWAGMVLPDDLPFLLVLNTPSEAINAITQLTMIGIDNIIGYLEGGMPAWQSKGYPTSRLDTLSVSDLNNMIETGDNKYIIDVRTDAEWKAFHIKQAHHIAISQLHSHLDEIPKDQSIVVICGSGLRSSIACSVLKRNNISSIANVLGGMTAWRSAGFAGV